MIKKATDDLAYVLEPYGIELHTFQGQRFGTPAADVPVLLRYTNAAGARIDINDVFLDESGSVIQYGQITLGR